MRITGVECFFCKDSIVENLNDPLDLKIVFSKDAIEKTGSFQIFYAHIDCFRDKLHFDNKDFLIIDEMRAVRLECCFCKNSIIEDATDPVHINIISNQNAIEKTGKTKLFHAHFDCLRNAVHAFNQGYLIREDEE